MTSMAIATLKVSTTGVALPWPSARGKYCLCREFCNVRNSATSSSFRNPKPVTIGNRMQAVEVAAQPAESDGWDSTNFFVDSLGAKQSSIPASGRGRRKSFVPTRAAAKVATDAFATATATTTSNSFEELRCKSESYFLTDSRPVVLFDGICNFCNSGVNFLLDNDPEGKFRFASLQSGAGRALLVKSGRSEDDLSSIVLVYKDRSYIKSEAVLRMCRELAFPFTSAGLVGLLFPLFIRDGVYDQVANNRYNIYGTSNSCRLSDPRFPERFVE